MVTARADQKCQNRRPSAAHVTVPRFGPYHRSSILQFQEGGHSNCIFLLRVWTSRGDLRVCKMMYGWEVHLGLLYLLGCIAILGNFVRTHPTGPDINGGHIEKRFPALCVVFCGVLKAVYQRVLLADQPKRGSLGIQYYLVARKLSQLRLRIEIYN